MATSDVYCEAIESLKSTKTHLTKDELKLSFNRILGERVVKFIEEDNTKALLVVFKSRFGLRVMKAESGYLPDTTSKEIEWYRSLGANNNVAPCFHGGFYDQYLAIYELEFLEQFRSLGSVFCDNNIGFDDLKKYVAKSVEILFELYNSKNIFTLGAVEIERLYWRKISLRMNEAKCILWLRELLALKNVVINGCEYLGVPLIMEKISQERYLEKFVPQSVGFIHGDLHFGNILINGDSVKFVDPNGATRMPIEYDLGKLLHSFHGLYDYIFILPRGLPRGPCKGRSGNHWFPV
jgi:hypothetical protein